MFGVDYPEPGIMSHRFGTTSGTYPDLDVFDRVVTDRWTRDLSTDVDFYRVALTWDRASNITSADDQIHAGFDVKYTIDDVDRVTRAQEGTLGGGSISSTTRDQQWGLDQVGNWDTNKHDRDGDGTYIDPDELDEVRTHNDVNELTARDIDNDSSDDYTLVYDEVGNLIDDGEAYKYEWDPFGRLRFVYDQGDDLVAEYRYNGLGYRIAVHEDTDTDNDVDGSDLWYYDAFDERWRDVARFRSSDGSPKVEFLYHAAGLDGRGGSSYIDLVVLRDRDNNTAWTSASDGVLEARGYYCQNWRADVSVIVGSRGNLQHWVKYSAYGIPFGLPGADTDSDGDCDATDVTQVQTWINAPAYIVIGDIDLDGDVDAADKAEIQSTYQGDTGGWGVLSPSGVGHRKGLGGRIHLVAHAVGSRFRDWDILLGRWTRRDPLEYVDGMSLYEATASSPVKNQDWTGLHPDDPVLIWIPCRARPMGWLGTAKFANGAWYRLWPEIDPATTGRPSQCSRVGSCQWTTRIRFKLQVNTGGGYAGWACPNPDPQMNRHCDYWHSRPLGAAHRGPDWDIPPEWSTHPPLNNDSEWGTGDQTISVPCPQSKTYDVKITSPNGHTTLAVYFVFDCAACPPTPW